MSRPSSRVVRCVVSVLALFVTPSLALAQTTATSALAVTFNGQTWRFDGPLSSATLVGNVGFTNLNAMTRDFQGRFIASSGGGTTTPAKLIAIDPSTGAGTLLATLSMNGDVRGLAMENRDSLLAIVKASTAQLWRIDQHTYAATLIGSTGLQNVQGLATTPSGTVYGWDAGSLGNNGLGLVELSVLGGAATDVSAANGGDSGIQSLGCDPSGALVGLRNQLFTISNTTGAATPLPDVVAQDFRGFEYEHGASFYDGALAIDLDGTVRRVNSVTGATSVARSLSGASYAAMVRDPLNQHVLVAHAFNSNTQLLELDPETFVTLASGSVQISNVTGLAFAPGPVLYAVTDESSQPDRLWSIDLNTHAATLVGPLGTTAIRDLAIVFGGAAFGWDSLLGLVRIDLQTGQTTDVDPSSNTQDIEALTIDTRGHLLGLDDAAAGVQSIYEIDMTSGIATATATVSTGDLRGWTFLHSTVFELPQIYCTAQTNSSGCVPNIFVNGTSYPSVTGGGTAFVGAGLVLGGKAGILFYGFTGRTAFAFQGGTMCVALPVHRTPVQISAGGAGCSGSFLFDFNAYIASGADPSLVGGQSINAQYWSRDPAATSTTNLTNAVEFEIAP